MWSQTARGKSPLYIAVELDWTECVWILLWKCKIEDVFRETNFGTTPLFMADKRGNSEIIKILESFTRPKMTKE